MSTPTMPRMLDPYTLTTFSQAYKAGMAFDALMASQAPTTDQIRQAWPELKKHLFHLVGVSPEGTSECNFAMTTEAIGMPTADQMGLSDWPATNWERLRVLHGLAVQLQIYVMTSASLIADRPQSADLLSCGIRQLVCEISDVLAECDNLTDVPPWVAQVLGQAETEHEAAGATR